MLNDAWKNSYDCAVLISNDSDFVEAVKLVKLLGKKVIILLHRKTKQSQMLCSHADAVLRYSDSQLAISQLPNPIPGTTIRKPANW
ncbi:MAG: NYN domain-containing protein [Bacteroidetes bacterium]|nr:NYN domain-containing protein [Bacteroidota bacterium]